MTSRDPMPSTVVLALSGLLASISLTGCGLWVERMCSEGEQPTYAIDNPTGGQCIKDGATPPIGFATYPPQRVPEEVGDDYDRWPLAADYPWADEVSAQVRRLKAEVDAGS